MISDRRCRSIGDRSKSRAGGGRLEAKAVGRQASRGGIRLCGSGGGISATMVSRGPATGRIDRKKPCSCRYVAFPVSPVAKALRLFERGHVLLVSRPRHAEPKGSITCHQCRSLWQLWYQATINKKEKVFTVPSRSSTGTMEGNPRAFLRRSHAIRANRTAPPPTKTTNGRRARRGRSGSSSCT